MSHITLVRDDARSPLEGLLARARELFDAGPVQEFPVGPQGRPQLIAVTITEAARHATLEWYGDGTRGLGELEEQLTQLNPQFSLTELGAWRRAFRTGFFPRAVTCDDLVLLSQATVWVIRTLESVPVTKEESDRRYELRERPEQLLQPADGPEPARRRRRRRPTGS